MKRFCLMLICLVLLFPVGSLAHSPRNITAEFDLEKHILSAEVVHTVGEVSKTHFVEEIIISHNGDKIIEQKISSQLSDNQTFQYYMPGIEAGDMIVIEVYCSVQGEKTLEFTVKEE
jgi:hypothetical protein